MRTLFTLTLLLLLIPMTGCRLGGVRSGGGPTGGDPGGQLSQPEDPGQYGPQQQQEQPASSDAGIHGPDGRQASDTGQGPAGARHVAPETTTNPPGPGNEQPKGREEKKKDETNPGGAVDDETPKSGTRGGGSPAPNPDPNPSEDTVPAPQRIAPELTEERQVAKFVESTQARALALSGEFATKKTSESLEEQANHVFDLLAKLSMQFRTNTKLQKATLGTSVFNNQTVQQVIASQINELITNYEIASDPEKALHQLQTKFDALPEGLDKARLSRYIELAKGLKGKGLKLPPDYFKRTFEKFCESQQIKGAQQQSLFISVQALALPISAEFVALLRKK